MDDMKRKLIDIAMVEIRDELERAIDLHGEFNSAHEGYAVILEELDELWEEVRKRKEQRTMGRMGKEAIQVAAMAVRFLVDVSMPAVFEHPAATRGTGR